MVLERTAINEVALGAKEVRREEDIGAKSREKGIKLGGWGLWKRWKRSCGWVLILSVKT